MEDAMAEKQQPKMRIMLNSYEQQLMAARRMARFKVRQRLAEGLEPDDPDMSWKRQVFANKISQELFDSLLFYPDASPVVDEIREELSAALGKKVEFTYPPGGTLHLAVREDGHLRKLNAQEQEAARIVLKRITGAKVDKTLFENHMSINTRA